MTQVWFQQMAFVPSENAREHLKYLIHRNKISFIKNEALKMKTHEKLKTHEN